MGFFSRILGLSKTSPPADLGCWQCLGSSVTIDLSRAPELNADGGAIRLEGSGLPERILVFKGEDSEFYALKNKCTHFGRRLDPLPGQPMLECCSVNKSTFEYSGAKKTGPAKGPAVSLPVVKQENQLTVDLSPLQ